MYPKVFAVHQSRPSILATAGGHHTVDLIVRTYPQNPTVCHAPQSLANLLWAYAKLSHPPPEPLLSALATCAARVEHKLEPRHVAGTLWALASLRGGGGNTAGQLKEIDITWPRLLAQRAHQQLLEGCCNSQVKKLSHMSGVAELT